MSMEVKFDIVFHDGLSDDLEDKIRDAVHDEYPNCSIYPYIDMLTFVCPVEDEAAIKKIIKDALA